ncbi:Sugar transporter STL1 [Hyphodiscus hymeniophilus]|uniref:Sugar transporter STL1 n=1 Tax=Hyphodiscus hymeniophilus TaxID=353542 RepID=A0A9P6VK15_9HELO|nr:Sugar transporter STL1 [Hyphodiscus hymeniophilus]
MDLFTTSLRGKSLTRLLGVVGALAFTLQGYDQAVANGTTVALYEVGAALGALSCAFIGDILGRRRTVFYAGCVCIAGIIIQATPFSLGQLIAGRLITAHRGRLVLLEGLFAIAGVALATWIDFGFYYAQKTSVSWRFPIAFQGIFAITVVSLVNFLPESPRWLVKKDRTEEAGDDDAPTESTAVARDIANIRQSLLDDAEGTSGNPFAFTHNRHFHRTILALGVNLLAQMSGVNIITFYSDTIFEEQLGFSGTTARIISGCLQLWQVFAAGLGVLLIDRFGRRRLLIFSSAGMMVSQACLAGLQSDTTNKGASSASLLFFFTALFCFPIGFFLLPFMYAAEIAPLRIRSKVTAMSAGINWLFNFMIAEVTPIGFSTIGFRYYIIYAAINAFSVTVFYLFYPETKGRTLEEVDAIFAQSRNVFDPVKLARSLPFQEAVEAQTDAKTAEAEREKEGWEESV